MQPEELAQQGVMNLAGLLILTAIPVVAFALWCDYFERFFQARLDEKEQVDRPEELYRIRTAGFFVHLFQIVIFFGTTPIRREHPLVAYPLFLAAMLVQLGIQRSLEGKIHDSRRGVGEAASGGATDSGSTFWQVLRTFFWSLAAGVSYITVILLSTFIFAAIGLLAGAAVPMKISLLICGMALGVLGGLSLNFALGAFFVRKIMNARPVREGDLFEKFSALFVEAKMPIPDFWIIEIPQFHMGSAMMAGFPSGRGLFRPGLFVSGELLRGLNEDEVRSVVLHEISHWRLKHLRKRFVFSSGLIMCASLVTGATVLFSRFLAASEQAQGMAGCMALVISFAFAFRMLGQQVKYQEFTADIHSIERLGSKLGDLSSALRKLDRMNDELPYKKDPGSMLLSLGHPATEYRIRILEKYFERKATQATAPAPAAANEAGPSDKAA